MKTLRSCSISWTNLRFIVFLAFIICSQFLNAQVNVKIDNQPIRSILKTIEKNSDFTFFFNEGLPELDKNASLDVSDVTAEIAVKQLLQGTNIAYAIEGKTIILTAKEKLESTRASSTTSSRQSVQRSNVTGIVTDETGEPLIGVSVVVKGTTTGVITNIDGRYSLNNVPVSGTLVFSYVGMKQMEVSVESRSRIDVIMSMESKIIDELVVIGYGTVKKRDLTGSVSSVKTDNINMNSTISIGQALKGKAAGLTIVQNSAQPGGRS